MRWMERLRGVFDPDLNIMATGPGNERAFKIVDGAPWAAPVGTHANAWDDETTGIEGASNAVDCEWTPHITVFGETDDATDLNVEISQNGEDWYVVEDLEQIIAASDGDVELSFTTGARYVRLVSSADVTATFTIAAKA